MSPDRKRSTFRSRAPWRRSALLGLIALVPAVMGGCLEFRNNLVNIANDTTQDVILGGQDRQTAWDAAVREALSAAIDLLFDRFRDDSVR